TRPSWLSSAQLPQISAGGAHAGSAAQSGSAQSVSPSQSLSMPSPHTSGPTTHGQPVTGACAHTPVAQVSVVQRSASSHWAALVHGRQPGIGVLAQLPALHAAVVHALPSLQSATVVPPVQANAAVPLTCTVSVAPMGSAGTRTVGGSAATTVGVTLGSSDEAVTSGLETKGGSPAAVTTTPLAASEPPFPTVNV